MAGNTINKASSLYPNSLGLNNNSSNKLLKLIHSRKNVMNCFLKLNNTIHSKNTNNPFPT